MLVNVIVCLYFALKIQLKKNCVLQLCLALSVVFSDSNMLIVYCVCVRDMQGTYNLSFVYAKYISIYLWSRSLFRNNFCILHQAKFKF